MSQVRRPGQGTDYGYHQHQPPSPLPPPPPHPPPSSPLPLPPLSPAAVRHSSSSAQPSPLSPSFTGNLIPRDYLGPRPDQHQHQHNQRNHHHHQQHSLRTVSGAAAVTAAPRKPIPSPLQTSVQSQSPRSDESTSSQSPLSPRPSSSASASPFQNRSPVGHIVHAAFPAPPASTGHSLSGQSEATGKKPLSRHHHDRDVTDEKVNRTHNPHPKPRKASDTTDSNQSTTSSPSPISTVSSLQSMAGDRPGQRVMPRTSSIDSAISSLSSASQSHKASFDAGAVSQADIENLISTAGSPEAVIIHLLKEKHHAASQNSQLWRLVDKQRTLILGLNKDHERALKEKERYKKRVKELQSLVPPVPSNSDQTSPPRVAESDTSSAYGTVQPSGYTGHYNQGGELGNRDATRSVESGPTNGSSSSFDDPRPRALPTNDMPAGSVGEVHNTEKRGTSRELSAASPSSLESSSPAANYPSSIENKPEKLPNPMRKPPPAPLNLGQVGGTIMEQRESDNSESEYEDIDAIDEQPAHRGRKKTRDEDDREREAAFVKEQAAGNMPKENNFQPSKFARNPDNPPVLTGQTSSPPQVVTQSPPIERTGSLASILSPRLGHSGSLNERSFLSSAPKSPGLPTSPRPEDRPVGSPLPRMPRDMLSSLPPVSIPSDSNNISGLALSPRIASHQHPFAPGESSNSAPPIPSIDAAVKIDSPKSPNLPNDGIYHGLVSDEHPDLLLPPNALPLIEVKVSSSRLRPSRNSYMASKPAEEEPVFTLSVASRSENRELWRVEKVIAALPQLDQQIRQLSTFAGKLPDRSIFSGHSPAKIDARRAALTSYFDTLLETPMDEQAALVVCQFLTSDAIEARDDETSLLKDNNQVKSEILRGPDGKPRKEGYLTKRGKNFGGWKARYFVLHGPELRYFESPGGAHMGTVKIPHAQIGKQSQNTQSNSPPRVDEDSDNQYRHAFLILEPKKKDSSALVRHVLCAESDEDRDSWVEVLLEYVEGHAPESESSNSTNTKSQPQATGKQPSNSGPKPPKLFTNGGKKNGKGTEHADSDGPDTVQGFSFDDAVPAEPPILGSPLEKQPPKSPIFPSSPWGFSTDTSQSINTIPEHGQYAPQQKVISGPTNGAVIQDVGAWGNKASAPTSTKEKKRSIWSFRTRSSMDIATQIQQAGHESPTAQMQGSVPSDRKDFVRPVFGIPLAEAVQYCAPQGVDVNLPAVVYRCIEYLNAKGAASEEGIFRLSGSNLVVKALKERFNTEGDVDFLAGDQYYDVHAVASLFKQYLRELPDTVLTRELHLEFLRVLGKYCTNPGI